MKTKSVLLLILAVSLLPLLVSCGKKKAGSGQETEANDSTNITTDNNNAAAQIPEGNENLNDAARFVAGMPVKNHNSKLNALAQMKEWKNHARNMDQIWNSFQQTTPKISAFTQNELSDINKQINTLFYPFGGPDFLFANAFFPNVDTYFLIGLERTGAPIEVKHPSQKTYKLYQDAVSDVLSLSFFRTRDMNVEAENDTIDGVVPIISMLMARTDKQIISIEYKGLNDKGEIVSTGKDGKPLTESDGLVEMKFFRTGSNKVQTLYYYATDLSNEGLQKNKPLMSYIERLRKNTTASFIKSASYLMHETSFSTIRGLIPEHSTAILQDDSGIPYTYFAPGQWGVTLYGTFYKPVATYAQYPQPELRNAYQMGEPKPLSFRIGFSRQSNLQLFRRK